MRSSLLGCARLVVLAMLTASCSRSGFSRSHGMRQVTVTAECTGNQVRIVVDPSSVHFKHTGGIWPFHQAPTDVNWTLVAASTADSVTIKADAAWPFDSATTFPVIRGTTRNRPGKENQDAGTYRYTVTVACPNGGPTAIFDPDVWVD